uniref:Uncharacterized protein n=1 Tax=Anguilla anguilla TaxID=7936 RepID=A0A0E9UG83_ANGAN
MPSAGAVEYCKFTELSLIPGHSSPATRCFANEDIGMQSC